MQNSNQLLRRSLGSVVILIIFTLLLAACGNREQPTPQVESNRQNQLRQTETVIALTNAPPTAGPSPTPTPSSTPFQAPTEFADADEGPEVVVAEIENRDITLEEFQARVRYERWLPFYSIARNIPDLEYDPRDLTLPENSNTLSLLYTVNQDPISFGRQVMNAYLTEQIALTEAAKLDLEVEQTIFDGRLAARIDVELGANGVRPPEWDEAYDTFITDMEAVTGMTEEQFLEHIQALTLYTQLQEIIREDATIVDEDVRSQVTVQDIVVDNRNEALTVIQRLEAGEDMAVIADDLGKIPSGGETERTIGRDAEGLTETIANELFTADRDEVVGPFPVSSGWYVGKVINFEVDIASPADLDAIKDEYYRQWIIERLDDPEYTTSQDDIWLRYVPRFPLPADVSPLLRTENFTLPPAAFPDAQATPTAIPLGESPR